METEFDIRVREFLYLKEKVKECQPLPTHFMITNEENTILSKLRTEKNGKPHLAIIFYGNNLGLKTGNIPETFGFPMDIQLPIECLYNDF